MSEKNEKRRFRPILFRMVAVLIGLSPFWVLEMGLRVCGWQPQLGLTEDPYVEFHSVRPLFATDDERQKMEVAANRFPLFRPESFDVVKSENEFRIFVLGGSTVQGRPYAIETSFTTWLELSLQAAAPERDWQVVNCGGVSYASYRLVPILEEVLAYEPDLIILYTGHNEFLEDRTYDHVKQMPSSLGQAYVTISNLKSFMLLRQMSGISTNPPVGNKEKTKLAEEVDALLDYQNGLEDYHRDPQWKQGVIEHFQLNLQNMIQMASNADVPLIMANPATNLKDCPPFKMVDSADLDEAARAESERLWAKARSMKPNQTELAIEYLRKAVQLNEGHAGLHYHLGQCYLQSGEREEARSCLTRAKDEDICPLRILSSMQEGIRKAASANGTPMVDIDLLFQELSKDGIPGDRWFLDHVHPTLAGHQQIAGRLVDEMVKQGFLSTQSGWELKRDQSYIDHLEGLDVLYFERGKQRLEGLRRWTKGRAQKVKGATARTNPQNDASEN